LTPRILVAVFAAFASIGMALLLGGVPVRSDQSPASILAWHDLPKDDGRSVELSGIAWEPRTSTLYVVGDDAPVIVKLTLSDDYRSLGLGESIAVNVTDPWDGEGIGLTSDGFLVSNESGPHIYQLDWDGQLISQIPLPRHFNRIRPNKSLESLAVADGGRYVISANEQALEGDGPLSTSEAGTVVRIIRVDRSSLETREWAYRTEPVFAAGAGADNGVADIAAISPSELVVLERAFVPGVGNSIRLYRVTLQDDTNTLETEFLTTETAVLPKTLVLDLATLPDDDFPPTRQAQPNRVLDNFEGLALGPMLDDGQRVLFLVSDDNQRAAQVTRLLVLAVSGL
jgi:hypothetical protein